MTTNTTPSRAVPVTTTTLVTGGRKPRRPRSFGKALTFWTFGMALAIVFVYPIIWTTISSFAPLAGTSQTDGWGFGNYEALATYQDGILVYLGNSTIVSLLTVVITTVVSLLGGYAFARFRFPGSNVLFLVVLSILMVPYATLLIPLYVMLNAVGLGNSLVGVAIVLSMFQMPFSLFMMRIAFEAVPRELDEAAMVDGCGRTTTLYRVLLPAVRPGLITVALFSFLAAWNDFIAPLILLSDTSQFTLPLAIANLRVQVQGVIDYGATEAGVVVLALPCVFLFLVLQRHYVRGFMSGAFKG
jgi:multiple sugar transport system permease protein